MGFIFFAVCYAGRAGLCIKLGEAFITNGANQPEYLEARRKIGDSIVLIKCTKHIFTFFGCIQFPMDTFKYCTCSSAYAQMHVQHAYDEATGSLRTVRPCAFWPTDARVVLETNRIRNTEDNCQYMMLYKRIVLCSSRLYSLLMTNGLQTASDEQNTDKRQAYCTTCVLQCGGSCS